MYHKIYKDSLVSSSGVISTNPEDHHNHIRHWDKEFFQDNVVCIAGCFSIAYFHFVADYLSSFKYLEDEDFSEYKILMRPMKDRKEYYTQWLSIVRPDIKLDNVIYKDAMVKNLISLKCAPPAKEPERYLFLREKVLHTVDNNNQDYFILTKRSEREISNWNELQEKCERYCKNNNLKLYIHDDKNLPSVIDQLNAFHRAKVVIGSHGAGFINLLACQKDTLFIENKLRNRFLEKKGIMREDPPVYEALADAIDIQYIKNYIEEDGSLDLSQFSSFIVM